jgi:hypothetical protein
MIIRGFGSDSSADRYITPTAPADDGYTVLPEADTSWVSEVPWTTEATRDTELVQPTTRSADALAPAPAPSAPAPTYTEPTYVPPERGVEPAEAPILAPPAPTYDEQAAAPLTAPTPTTTSLQPEVDARQNVLLMLQQLALEQQQQTFVQPQPGRVRVLAQPQPGSKGKATPVVDMPLIVPDKDVDVDVLKKPASKWPWLLGAAALAYLATRR